MDKIKKDAERILRDALFLLTKVREGKVQNSEIEPVLRDIINVCQNLLADEKDALKRVGLDMQRLFQGEEETRNAMERIGFDIKKMFE